LANFLFTAGPFYSAPPLVVETKLTTESSQGVIRGGQGQRLDSSGNVKLVGVARLAPVDDLFLSTFLTLPTDCLAELLGVPDIPSFGTNRAQFVYNTKFIFICRAVREPARIQAASALDSRLSKNLSYTTSML
jgi:hypothetical protein